jgi:hypothetical protein
MSRYTEAELHTDRTTGALTILGGTAAAIGGACFIAFGLWFAPGWANGWPFGLHRNVVWPAGLAVLSFAIILIAWAGVGFAAAESLGPRTGFRPPIIWLCLWMFACRWLGLLCGWYLKRCAHKPLSSGLDANVCLLPRQIANRQASPLRRSTSARAPAHRAAPTARREKPLSPPATPRTPGPASIPITRARRPRRDSSCSGN